MRFPEKIHSGSAWADRLKLGDDFVPLLLTGELLELLV